MSHSKYDPYAPKIRGFDPFADERTMRQQARDAGSTGTTLDAFVDVLRHAFMDEREWFVFDDPRAMEVVVLCFSEPKYGLLELEHDLDARRSAGVRLEVMQVSPYVDRDALDTLWRLNGLHAVRRELLDGGNVVTAR